MYLKFIKALFICFPLFASGQISYDFGKVSEAELMMQSYEKDPSAKAVIVFNRGDVELNDRLEVTMKRHVRIKFFDQTEVDEWANMTIYVSRGSSTISKIRASAYNLENGKLVESKMNEDAVFKTKINRYREEVKFAVPNVKAGSVIEYSYTIRSDAYWIPSWQFQYDIPVLFLQQRMITFRALIFIWKSTWFQHQELFAFYKVGGQCLKAFYKVWTLEAK